MFADFKSRLLACGVLICGSVIASIGLPQALVAADDALVVHEWGTFTALQDENGNELSGINTDDEPVPAFVHNLNRLVLTRPVLSSPHWQYRQKGVPRIHPQVTMRLETPVIYFYPPRSWPAGKTIDVQAQFRGGWLTEFYPKATAHAPGLDKGQFKLSRETTSSLAWNGLRLGGKAPGPATEEQVWLAPRKVTAANVTGADGESERYLFYRGVGQCRAPLRTVMDRTSGELSLYGNFDEVLSSDQTAEIPALWLVHVRQDGQCAFRQIAGFDVSSDLATGLGKASYCFAASDFRPENRKLLELTMHAALVSEGLYGDEATALLSTWQRSYFASPGLRLFYLVPRVWTDHYLPLSVSGEAQLVRVMVSRQELISDQQQALLVRLADLQTSDGKWIERIPESPARHRFLSGRTDFGNLGVSIPPDYQIYLDLGRFRNALVVHEERVRPTASLTTFVNNYQLHPFRIPPTTVANKQQ
jgi:hypothetical protein